MIKLLSTLLLLLGALTSTITAQGVMDGNVTHPLDGLTTLEHEAVLSILMEAGYATNTTLFAQVSLMEAPKAEVKAYIVGDDIPRSAVAYIKDEAGK